MFFKELAIAYVLKKLTKLLCLEISDAFMSHKIFSLMITLNIILSCDESAQKHKYHHQILVKNTETRIMAIRKKLDSRNWSIK